MQRVAVVPERHPAVGRHVVHVDVLVKHHHQLALGVNHRPHSCTAPADAAALRGASGPSHLAHFSEPEAGTM